MAKPERPTEPPVKTAESWQKLLWFVLYWVMGVLALAAVGLAIKLLLPVPPRH